MKVKDLIKWLEEWDRHINVLDTDLNDDLIKEHGIQIVEAQYKQCFDCKKEIQCISFDIKEAFK